MNSGSKGTGSKGTGAEYLVRKSDLAKTRKDLPTYQDILIIEDENLDANRLEATLRSMFGYDLKLRRASTLSKAVDLLIERAPELVFLDDYLKPIDTAADSIPMIRRANYQGAIIVVSGELTRDRRLALIAKGATETIHKDELDSVAIAEVLTRIASAAAASATSENMPAANSSDTANTKCA